MDEPDKTGGLASLKPSPETWGAVLVVVVEGAELRLPSVTLAIDGVLLSFASGDGAFLPSADWKSRLAPEESLPEVVLPPA